MKKRDQSTETVILEAAEAEFLEKGYGNAKMMAIAKRAGVSHSMLHYYFRSKENLFQTVFMNKVHVISNFIADIFDRHLSFEETTRLIIETQFNFIAANPRLPMFILNEILSNKENRELVLQTLSPKLLGILSKISGMLDAEIAAGRIRNITLIDFVMDIVSINVSTFIALPIVRDVYKDTPLKKILDARLESNVRLIINALKL